MLFQGKEIPEDEFRALARRSFHALLEEQDQQVRDAKGEKWFRRPPAVEQEMFSRWLRELGVEPFPFREPPPRGAQPPPPTSP